MTLSGSDYVVIAIGVLVVLIPLLVDDPLWEVQSDLNTNVAFGLNPSFSG